MTTFFPSLARLGLFERIVNLGEREDPVDQRSDAAVFHQPRDFFQLVSVRTRVKVLITRVVLSRCGQCLLGTSISIQNGIRSMRSATARHWTHVSTDHSPRRGALARPDARVAVSPAMNGTGHFHGEARTQTRNGDVGTDATDVEFLGDMLAEANGR